MQNPQFFSNNLIQDTFLNCIHTQKKEQELKEIQLRIEELRDKIADVFKEQKTYDIVDENRRKEQQKIFEQQQQKMLDEIGTNTYIKKHQE